MNSFLKQLVLYPFSKNEILKAPQLPGVYIFYNSQKKVLYVGKSVSLKNRLISYTNKHLGIKTTELISSVKYFSFVQVNSEVESLLFEAYLVKKFMPKYNIALKDDKTPLYIVIVKDKLPWITIARRTQLSSYKGSEIFGPFISGQKVNIVLKTLRRIFPFSNHPSTKKACFYSHIGLCNPCPGNIERETDLEAKKTLVNRYKVNISFIRKALNGNVSQIKEDLKKSMLEASKIQDFENANYYKQKLEALNYVTSYAQSPGTYFENPSLIDDIIEKELADLQTFIARHITISKLIRLECFDIAHISGNYPTASMVTFINGLPDKSYYRHFKIRQPKGNSDTDSLSEVARRRSKYLIKWGRPDLIIVDGGKGQVSKFFDIFDPLKITVVGIAKKEEQMVFVKVKNGEKTFRIVTMPKGPALYLIQKMRDEAHRFARRYHHHLFKANLLK